MNDVTTARYLNLWPNPNVSRETNIMLFPVVTIRGSGGEFVTTGDASAQTAAANVIIYHSKYGVEPNNIGAQPDHRAFMVRDAISGDLVPKITGGSVPNENTAWYQGDYPAGPIPCLDENAWIDFANNGGTPPANLADNYAGLSSDYKMTQPEWDTLENAD
jgi:hypothetical protein